MTYHHGRLREAAIAAAVREVAAVGATGVSMREIARRAGVSHAALAYQFGDKAGIFTAIATEGFRLAAETIGPSASGGFVDGGLAYIRFALTYPGHFEVMLRPDLCRAGDAELIAARDAAFQIMQGSAHAAAPDDEDVTGLVVAGWSFSHGFATLWLTGNLQGRLGTDPAAFTDDILRGIVTLGDLARRRLASGQD